MLPPHPYPYRKRHTVLRAAVYVCCSTAGTTREGSIPEALRNPLVQRAPLVEFIRLRRWSLHRIYADQLTGDKQARPGFNQLMEDARHHRFEVIVLACLEQLAPNLKRLVFTLDELYRLGIGLVSRLEWLDTTNLVGGSVMAIVRAMARLERNAVGARVGEGLDHARQYGTKSGRPVGRPKCELDTARATELRDRGWSYRRIAEELDVGLGTITRALSKGH